MLAALPKCQQTRPQCHYQSNYLMSVSFYAKEIVFKYKSAQWTLLLKLDVYELID
jgi:hypothetical protein